MAEFVRSDARKSAITWRASTAIAIILALSGCFTDTGGVSLGNNNPSAGVQTLARPNPDARGVITYSTYQVMVAQQGDTIESMAQRVGLSPAELANHNGLPAGYRPRAGEVIALPKNVGGSVSDNGWTPQSVWTPEVATSALDNVSPGQATTTISSPFSNGQTTTVVDPVRHRVKSGETAYSIARLYGVSVTSLASWNGLSSDLAVRENQELLIPVATSEIRTASVNRPGSNSTIAPPPSASDPLPSNETVEPVALPASPNLGAQRTSTAPRLQAPVAGRIIKPYSTSPGAAKNEGVDIAAAAGTTVKAAADGEVALISESLGGLGTIVLVRHEDNLMTVYGRVTGVTLKKGDRVRVGDKIGVVAPSENPNVHFEVRKGSAPVDPAPYL
jgi:LysM repeat protein